MQVLRGALICAWVFPFISTERRMQHVGRWSARMLDVLGIELQVSGTAAVGATLFVANHVSWLDILAINAVRPLRFVSKSDIRSWPVLGWLVACGGTLFIERERPRDSVRVVHLIAEALKAGGQIAVFPEGTTSDGHGVLPFHANLLQAAVSTQVPIQAIALRYCDAQRPVSAAAAYTGDTTLMESLWAVVTGERLRVRVTLLPVHPMADMDRRALAQQLRNRIASALVSRTAGA